MPPGKITDVHLTPILYFCKIAAASIALIYFWKFYDELHLKKFNFLSLFLALLVGLLVFVFWIHMDQPFATMGSPTIYDPHQLTSTLFYGFIFIRLFGASIVVPIFEELFWRSLILRYIINPDFTSVRIGTFSWPSFVISSVLFGLEHHFWLAGIMAGVFYNLLLYRTKNIIYCIIAHGLTNLVLGLYVLKTGLWKFW
jgi:CAAX prenyl protease-like protein